AAVRHRVVLADEVAERGVRVVVDVVVGGADAVLVGEGDGGVFEHQFEDVVDVAVGARDGTEDTDAGGGRAQRLQHAQGDRRLPGVPFRSCDVDARDGPCSSTHGF